jgi:hypothetical protein
MESLPGLLVPGLVYLVNKTDNKGKGFKNSFKKVSVELTLLQNRWNMQCN